MAGGEAMADIVTTSLRIGARTDGAMDITIGPLVNRGLWPGTTTGSNSEPGTDRCDESQTGLQHLTVINQSHQQYLQKTCRIYMSISPPSAKVMRRITWHA
ncbi:MAG: FAD:protein FMN transferase [Escherichia coli]